MEKLKEFFKSIEIDKEDYLSMLELCPGLEIADEDKMLKCIDLLVRYGYPKTDLDSLLIINPTILMYEPIDLEEKLEKLLLSGIELETLLKEDAYII